MTIFDEALPLRPIVSAFYARDPETVARDLLGCLLVHETGEGRVVGMIVETEAYAEDDPGSHAARGRTQRNAPMFEAPGRAYVYFTYGMHTCLNAVTRPEGVGSAVLIRAAHPVHGVELMRQRRGVVKDRDLARGPGRLTQAFGITLEHNRSDLARPPLYICTGERLPEEAIAQGPRIGLGDRQDGRPWRFWLSGSPWVSAPQPDGRPRRSAPARDRLR